MVSTAHGKLPQQLKGSHDMSQPNKNPALPRGPAYDVTGTLTPGVVFSSTEVSGGVESDGGPSSYYDFPADWKTWNDFADYKSTKQWKEHSFHLGNVGKVLCRWGDKAGTTKSYDARKLVYSGLRVLLMLEGEQKVRSYLESLLEDPQFKPR
jgi:hypothetical protein